jgi:hypothetical protein
MTSDTSHAVSHFRLVFPELSAMPDEVLVSRIQRLREIEAAIRHIEWLESCEAIERDSSRDGELPWGE